MNFAKVTKDAFYAKVGPLNVHPRSERDVTFWETPARDIIGKSVPGYVPNDNPTEYYLARRED